MLLCREWFQKFKNGEFDIEDKERRRKYYCVQIYKYNTKKYNYILSIKITYQ